MRRAETWLWLLVLLLSIEILGEAVGAVQELRDFKDVEVSVAWRPMAQNSTHMWVELRTIIANGGSSVVYLSEVVANASVEGSLIAERSWEGLSVEPEGELALTFRVALPFSLFNGSSSVCLEVVVVLKAGIRGLIVPHFIPQGLLPERSEKLEARIAP